MCTARKKKKKERKKKEDENMHVRRAAYSDPASRSFLGSFVCPALRPPRPPNSRARTVETADAEEGQALQGETSYSGTLVSSKSINPPPPQPPVGCDAAAAAARVI